jgi:hypothetical protein
MDTGGSIIGAQKFDTIPSQCIMETDLYLRRGLVTAGNDGNTGNIW